MNTMSLSEIQDAYREVLGKKEIFPAETLSWDDALQQAKKTEEQDALLDKQARHARSMLTEKAWRERLVDAAEERARREKIRLRHLLPTKEVAALKKEKEGLPKRVRRSKALAFGTACAVGYALFACWPLLAPTMAALLPASLADGAMIAFVGLPSLTASLLVSIFHTDRLVARSFEIGRKLWDHKEAKGGQLDHLQQNAARLNLKFDPSSAVPLPDPARKDEIARETRPYAMARMVEDKDGSFESFYNCAKTLADGQGTKGALQTIRAVRALAKTDPCAQRRDVRASGALVTAASGSALPVEEAMERSGLVRHMVFLLQAEP